METLLALTELYTKFRLIERTIQSPGTDRKENDAEHSYHLALTAWALMDALGLQLDRGKVYELCLAHDLVEVYAGDTFVYANVSEQASKETREAAAAVTIAEVLPGFAGLSQAIAHYEHKASEEACFVYALDKFVPILVMYLDGGRVWHEHAITLEMVHQAKDAKIAMHPAVDGYYQQMLLLLEQRPELFPAAVLPTATE
jgi:putative hydrolases of HD superfamily